VACVIVPIGPAWNSHPNAKLSPELNLDGALTMDTRLFTERSIWTMIHGIVLGGGALMALSAALFSLRAMRTENIADAASENQSRYLPDPVRNRLLISTEVLATPSLLSVRSL
jgi:hypothetical protein